MSTRNKRREGHDLMCAARKIAAALKAASTEDLKAAKVESMTKFDMEQSADSFLWVCERYVATFNKITSKEG